MATGFACQVFLVDGLELGKEDGLEDELEEPDDNSHAAIVLFVIVFIKPFSQKCKPGILTALQIKLQQHHPTPLLRSY